MATEQLQSDLDMLREKQRVRSCAALGCLLLLLLLCVCVC